MKRTRAARKRGRPADPNARRRQTTRAGRRGEPLVDHGAPRLVAKKQARANGRKDVDETDLIGLMLAHGALDPDQLVTLRLVENWVVRARRARALPAASVDGLWQAVLSGQRSEGWVAPIGSASEATPGDWAWWQLTRLRNDFARRHELGALAIVLRVVEGVGLPTPSEAGAFAAGLAAIADIIRRGRRRWPRL